MLQTKAPCDVCWKSLDYTARFFGDWVLVFALSHIPCRFDKIPFSWGMFHVPRAGTWWKCSIRTGTQRWTWQISTQSGNKASEQRSRTWPRKTLQALKIVIVVVVVGVAVAVVAAVVVVVVIVVVFCCCYGCFCCGCCCCMSCPICCHGPKYCPSPI